MIKSLFNFMRKKGDHKASKVPEGMRVYAIGDIHGRVDLLRQLHGLIRVDASDAAEQTNKTVVYLGDYVDRGLESRAVIELLLDQPLSGFDPVFLKGNHEEFLLRFLEDDTIGVDWFTYGGNATVYSYGIRVPNEIEPVRRFPHIRTELEKTVPARHLEFLSRMELSKEIGDYLFVHAGVRPGRALSSQTSEDLLWIRDEFIDSTADHGKIIVHGHHITPEPDIQENRIGIDTGAYVSGNLTCLVLEGTGRRFLSTNG